MIILVFGSQGSGKTLFLVKESLSAYHRGETVYSNFNLKIPHKILHFDDIINTRLERCTCIIDEAHIWGGLNARQSMSKRNIEITNNFVSQCRKKDVLLLCSTQLPRNLDVKLRENASYYIFCSKKVWKGNSWVEAIEGCDYEKSPIVITLEVLHLATEKCVTVRFSGNEFFGLYDTTEIIRTQ